MGDSHQRQGHKIVLGFANYYHWFVPNYASIAAPLTMLTKKGVLWHWGPLQCRAFANLQSALCATPLLIYLDPSLPYTVVSDALEMLLEEY